MTKPFACPHCAKELSIDLMTTLVPESAMRMVLKPKEGERLSLDTVGGTMADMAKLLKTIGKSQGIHAEVLLDDFKVLPDGGVDFGFVVARFEKPAGLPKAKKRGKADA